MEQGRIIGGHYRIVGKAGKGGMGEVFLAEDFRTHKKWAVKRTTRREYRILEIPRHPGIPFVIGWVEEEDGFYMIMEYMDGITLQEYLHRAGRVSEKQAEEWIRELAAILSYLHGLRPPVWHLDVKPSNIMLLEGKGLGLIDLGAATEAACILTDRAGWYGTRGYAPPEQSKGVSFCDQRSDIYSVGMTLYHMVSGNDPALPPFGIQRGRGWAEDAGIGKGIWKIICKCTEEKKEERYQTMEELREAFHYIQRAGRGHSFIRCREKSIFHTEKKKTGLFLVLLFCLCSLWGGQKEKADAGERILPVTIRNEAGQKILLMEGTVYPVTEKLLLELSESALERGKTYEVIVELRERKQEGSERKSLPIRISTGREQVSGVDSKKSGVLH